MLVMMSSRWRWASTLDCRWGSHHTLESTHLGYPSPIPALETLG